MSIYGDENRPSIVRSGTSFTASGSEGTASLRDRAAEDGLLRDGIPVGCLAGDGVGDHAPAMGQASGRGFRLCITRCLLHSRNASAVVGHACARHLLGLAFALGEQGEDEAVQRGGHLLVAGGGQLHHAQVVLTHAVRESRAALQGEAHGE